MMAVLIDKNETCELHASNKWATGCCKNRKARIQLYTWQLYAATAEYWSSHTQRPVLRDFYMQLFCQLAMR
jgi:hypothetical protein